VPTSCAAKVRLVAERVTAGAIPVPVNPTCCGLPGALSVTLTEADRAPDAVGVKVTVTAQAAPGVSIDGQLFVWPKSPGSAPVTEMLETVNARLPVFVSMIACDGLVVPTFWMLKDKLGGLRACLKSVVHAVSRRSISRIVVM
jgi:hypothetical protein